MSEEQKVWLVSVLWWKDNDDDNCLGVTRDDEVLRENWMKTLCVVLRNAVCCIYSPRVVSKDTFPRQTSLLFSQTVRDFQMIHA